MARPRPGDYTAAALIAGALAIASVVATASAQQGGAGRGGFVAYPQRPPGNPAAIERGKTLWGVNCSVLPRAGRAWR